jgi:colanic acid biosynthesis glycosyl transferase WcaI
MRILVLGINYAPEQTSVAPFATGFCEDLAANGNKVIVVTAFPYYPEWRVWEGYRGSLYRKECINGVTVHRVAHYVPRKPSRLIERLAYDISFTVNCFLAALFTGGCDLIYCYCPPPTVAFAAYLLGLIKGAAYVMKVSDLASDVALATGIMKPGFAIRLARMFEAFSYRKAKAVICVCQGFIDRLRERGVSEEKLHLIPDWGDTENLRPGEAGSAFRLANQLSTKQFLVFHTGNMGKKQRLMNVVNAAEASRNERDLKWIIVGQGEEKSQLEEEISRRGLTNTMMLPLQPAELLTGMYGSADLLLLNQAASVEDAVIPSKLLTYMGAGRAIVAAVSEKSEAARQIHRADCGVVVPPENPEALAAAVLLLRKDAGLRRRLGANARAFAETHFTKAGVLRRYDEFFRSLRPGVKGLSMVRRGAEND